MARAKLPGGRGPRKGPDAQVDLQNELLFRRGLVPGPFECTTLHATDAVTFDSTLSVAGASTLGATSTGALTVTTLHATDAVTLDTTLAVTGITTATGRLNADGGIDRTTAVALVLGAATATDVTLGNAGTSATVPGVLYANGGVDRSTAAVLAIGATNATGVNVTAKLNANGGLDRSSAAALAIGATSATSVVITPNTTITGTSTLTGAAYANGGLDRSTAAALLIGATNATSVTITPNTTVSGTTTSTGLLTATAGLKGSTTNDAATAGNVGERLVASRVRSAKTSVTTSATAQNVLASALSVTAGDWLVSGIIVYETTNASTSITEWNGSISLTSATLSAADTIGVPTSNELRMQHSSAAQVPGNSENFSVVFPPFRVSFSTTTSLYLVAHAVFTVSTLSVFGSIGATRIR